MKYVLSIFALLFSSVAFAVDPSVIAESALVIDADSGRVLYQKGASETRSIASITKLMSAVVLLDSGVSLEEHVTITPQEVEATKLRGQPTSTSLPVGVTLTRAELLHLTLMNSQNRAVSALARSYPGGQQAFVQAMNDKAAALNMTRTKFVEPSGLYNQNVSTADDLALLVNAASSYQQIRELSTSQIFKYTTYSKKKKHTARFGTTNRLVASGTWDIVLQKTGYIKDAGRCLVMMSWIGAKRVIIVLLNTTNSTQRAADANTIKTWIEQQKIPVAMYKDPAMVDVKHP